MTVSDGGSLGRGSSVGSETNPDDDDDDNDDDGLQIALNAKIYCC